MGLTERDNAYALEELSKDLERTKRDVAKVKIHPKWDGLGKGGVDLALVKLKKPMKWSKHVMPICLPWNKRKPYRTEALWFMFELGRLFNGSVCCRLLPVAFSLQLFTNQGLFS